MPKHLLLVILMSLTFSAYSDAEIQTDWSSGPGEAGPVLQWFGAFCEGSGIDITQPGSMELGTSVVSFDMNLISDDFGVYGITAPGDFDGDGDIDIICDDIDQWKFALFENLDGIGTQWQKHELFDMPWIPNKRSDVIDLDMDGDLDFLTATGPYFTYWENSDGTGLNWEQHTISDIYGDAKQILAADIDNDGDLDVLGCDNQNGHIISSWENMDGIGHQWEEHLILDSLNVWPGFLEIADIDSDGDLDFFCGMKSSIGYVAWFENLGLWGWQQHVIDSSWYDITSIATADFNGDGDMDLAIIRYDTFRIYENLDGLGGSWEWVALPLPLLPDYGTGYLIPKDVDNDGDMDIVASASEPNTTSEDFLLIYENLDGFGCDWGVHTIKTEFNTARFRALADINDDGYIDFLLAEPSSPSISWFDVVGPAESGWAQSSILDVVGYPQWDTISWLSTEPTGTDVSLLLRSSNDSDDMGEWCDTILDSGNLAGYIDSTHRYIQYRVCMTTEDGDWSPILEEISLVWSSMGIEGAGNTLALSISASPNPSLNGVSITVPAWTNGNTEITVYDIAGKLVRIVTDRSGENFLWDCRDSSGHEIPSGTYIIRCASGEISASTKLVKL